MLFYKKKKKKFEISNKGWKNAEVSNGKLVFILKEVQEIFYALFVRGQYFAQYRFV